eukprot:TRINITY_DN58219_c0_g1_i1.p1 TRINITY_DN58219_c0_g1~~TRINITY_DN58219_c0_g1_i1.p1  ORF type:complete len:435 (-),score=66.28 TRINITY_DN58219_c0_g1_i1:93-1397(-)
MCIRDSYTEVYVWGNDTFGQLGISSGGIGKSYCRPKFCSFNIMIKSVACGEEHTAMITRDGYVYTMGNNLFGRLGLGDKSLTHSPVPCLVESLFGEQIVQVACGVSHTLALNDKGVVFAWGLGEHGALGVGDRYTHYAPELIEKFTSSEIESISCGHRHSTFLAVDGTLFGCGACDSGQLGNGKKEIEFSPIQIGSIITDKITSATCGPFSTYAISSKGEAWATGGNSFGQLGVGTKKPSNIFVKIPELHNIKKITCGHHAMALTLDGGLYVWGTGIFGEVLIPRKFTEIKVKIVDISIGGTLGIALDEQGRIWSWGSNTSGELGLGDYDPRSQPSILAKLHSKKVVSISTGGSFVVALGVTHNIPKMAHSIRESMSEEKMKPLVFNKSPEESEPVSYTHLRAHETSLHLVCRLLLEKKKKKLPQTLYEQHHII